MSEKEKPYVINVPKGNGVIQYLEITPKLPKNGKQKQWPIKVVNSQGKGKKPFSPCDFSNSKQKIEALSINFCAQSDVMECSYERCILVLFINEALQSHWSFASDGIILNHIEVDAGQQIATFPIVSTSLSNNNKVMTAVVQSPVHANLSADFRYVAEYLDETSGSIATFASPDPAIIISRPRD